MKNNYVIILSAGVGTRLKPLTKKTPKSLIKVSNKPLLKYQLDGYLKAGIKPKNIYIVIGYLKTKIINFLKKNYPEVNFVENNKYDKTNNMYSLYIGLDKVKNITKNFKNIDQLFINNGDCIYDNKILFDFVNHNNNKNMIACQKNIYIEESMKISINSNKNIIDISKKIKKQKSFATSIDLYKYNKKTSIYLHKLIKSYIEQDKTQWTEVIFPILFKKKPVKPFNIKDQKWYEIDTFEDLLIAQKTFK